MILIPMQNTRQGVLDKLSIETLPASVSNLSFRAASDIRITVKHHLL